jgi:hypothetical protein
MFVVVRFEGTVGVSTALLYVASQPAAAVALPRKC